MYGLVVSLTPKGKNITGTNDDSVRRSIYTLITGLNPLKILDGIVHDEKCCYYTEQMIDIHIYLTTLKVASHLL